MEEMRRMEMKIIDMKAQMALLEAGTKHLMKPKLIKTAADHAAALARIDELFTAKPGTPEGDELDLLVTLVELYEEKQFPIALPSPVEAIRFRMEQQGLKPKETE